MDFSSKFSFPGGKEEPTDVEQQSHRFEFSRLQWNTDYQDGSGLDWKKTGINFFHSAFPVTHPSVPIALTRLRNLNSLYKTAKPRRTAPIVVRISHYGRFRCGTDAFFLVAPFPFSPHNSVGPCPFHLSDHKY